MNAIRIAQELYRRMVGNPVEFKNPVQVVEVFNKYKDELALQGYEINPERVSNFNKSLGKQFSNMVARHRTAPNKALVVKRCVVLKGDYKNIGYYVDVQEAPDRSEPYQLPFKLAS